MFAGIANSTRLVLTSLSDYESYPEEWKELWQTLETICRTTIDCGNLWMDKNKSVGKKRALSDLLKLLENSGLHKHKFEIMKVMDILCQFNLVAYACDYQSYKLNIVFSSW